MELNLETKQQLENLLAKPETVSQADAAMLGNLAKKFPYYQPLHLLLASASLNQENQNFSFATAALHNGGKLLHQMVNHPETFVAKQLLPDTSGNTITSQDFKMEPTDDSTPNETEEQEVFEEIAELDNIVVLSPSPTAENTLAEATHDDIAIENIVAQDFFAFEQNFTSVPSEKAAIISAPIIEEYNQEAEEQTVSKYNDEKLPYTFLWWLAKTRKEHEQIFQPYVTKKQTQNSEQPNDLQQQYVEHIFHLQTPFNPTEESKRIVVNRENHTKGDEIINNFIKNEPQIRAPKLEQINTENKAKKSAEDQDDLVSETLAAIYIEQMLYQKAIVTYEKLSLKFPEKSRYFANLIQSLEKKI